MIRAELKVLVQRLGLVATRQKNNLVLPQLIAGIKELGRVLHVSSSTVARWKSEGILDDVTFQNGKFISFDVYGVLEKLRVSNKKVKFNKKSKIL